jgi:hypothetical protein
LTRALIVAALAVSAAAPSWTEPRVLSDTDRALGPELALSSSGAALAVWDAETGPDCAQSPASLTCIHTVEVAARDGSGGGWGSPDRIARPGVGALPRVALNDAGRAAVIWVHDIGRDRVLQATYRTGPTTPFPNPSDLSAAVLGVRNHHVALDRAGNAAVVWAEDHGGAFDVAAEMRSAASGVWGAPVVLSTGAASAGPSLAVSPGGEAFAIWVEGAAVQVARGNLATGSWESPVALSRNAGVDAAIAVNAAGDAVAIWALGDRPGVEASIRPAGGPWGDPVALPDGAQFPASAGPDVGFGADGTAVAVWVSGGTSLQSLRSAARARGGSWSRPVEVASGHASDPNVSVDPQGNAIAVWTDRARLLAAVRPVAAGAWQPAEVSSAEVSAPRVALDAAGKGLAVWNLRSGDLIPVLTADFAASWEPTLDNTRLPAVRGRARVGRTVVCNRGAWAGTVPIHYGYGWLRKARPVGSAHESRYRIRRRDAGARLACRVTATNPARSLTVTSPFVRVR